MGAPAAPDLADDGAPRPDDVAALRSELANLRLAVEELGGDVRLRELQITIAELRDEVAALRRRVSLRAATSPTIDDAQLRLLAEAVAEQVGGQRGGGRRSRRAGG